jgi:hypothetical protein
MRCTFDAPPERIIFLSYKDNIIEAQDWMYSTMIVSLEYGMMLVLWLSWYFISEINQ